jgi:hypothetical protein
LGEAVEVLTDERLLELVLEEKDEEPVPAVTIAQSLRSKVDLRRRLNELGGVMFAHEEASDPIEIDESSARVCNDPLLLLLRDSFIVVLDPSPLRWP